MTYAKPGFSCGKLLTRIFPFVVLATFGCSSLPELEIGDDDGAKPDGSGGKVSGTGGSFNVGESGASNTGGATEPPAVCGNGKLEAGEVCDDGGTEGGDGCSGDCLTQDLNFVCTPGEACINTVVCGSGVVEGDEACDDGNEDGGDGCSGDCSEVEAGFACPRPGKDCISVPICGNGARDRGEACDDGQDVPSDGDGCSSTCQKEAGFFCPVLGQPCVAVVCGDGTRMFGEECDDGQATPTDGDGCSSTCKLEPGFRCSGTTCEPLCGDGILRGSEACDDNNRLSGDGCSAGCAVEPTYDCAGTPSVCTSTVVCGDGSVGLGELCDPPGVAGCLAGCKSFSPDAGESAVCGNQILEYGETCEGATLPYEGCLTGCQADTGYTCPRSGECFKIPACGDGIVQAGEGCDVGAASSSACQSCIVQDDWFCYGPGPSVCEQSVCGDGARGLDEECDDGNPTSSDGCTSCQVDSGYVCPTAGVKCVAKCGDGLVRGIEVCDDGDTDSGDGCSSTCRVEPGFFCTANPCADYEVPVSQNCGNGTVEGSEACDDGANDLPFDGCYNCKKDPVCSGGSCTSICGDGQRFGDEACDDGNTFNGDGCSSTCAVEDGFDCVDFTGTPPSTLALPVIARDFIGVNRQFDTTTNPTPNTWAAWQTSTKFHPDFNAQFGAAMRAMVKNTLDSNKKPQWNWVPYATQIAKPPATDLATEMPPTNLTQCSCGTSPDDTPPACTCSDSTVCYCDNPAARRWQGSTNSVKRPILSVPSRFAQWYANDPSVNLVKAVTVTLTRDIATGTYGFDSANTTQNGGKNFMDPFGSASGGQVFAEKETMANGTSCGGTAGDRNASWTTETHFWFEYAGGEKFDFAGDDDTWVFVDGKLVVDLGGLHGAMAGSFTLDKDDDGVGADTADGSAAFTTGMSASGTTTQYPANGTVNLGLVVGGVYEVVMFQAERNECGSNFKVTLKDFNKPKSVCTPKCGDGKVVGTEVCDDGSANNVDNTYGKCNATCSARLYCGDDIVTSPNETCDNGINIDTRDVGQPDACGPGCAAPGKCGDSIVQAAFEVCDKGASNSNTSYGAGSCTTDCGLGGYCGDGATQASYEACDDGTGNTGYQATPGGCGYDCQEAAHCGDGVRNGPEECDLGVDNGGVGKNCDATCHLLPYCGDGLIQSGEACDYGQFASNAYGGCNSSCQWGPSCGDGNPDPIEECDLGENNSSSYGADSCLTNCTRGPRCGDGVVQSSEGETCDNGFNEDTYEYIESACATGCTRAPYCGDGIVATGDEECDAGSANNDTTYEGCKLDCTWGPYCGDGIKQASEACDEGTANTAYSATEGGCGYDCKDAPYCGDGDKNGPEACDLGEENENGVYGGCNENCTLGPRCGDYIKQAGEGCDDGPVGSVNCSPTCKSRVITK